MTEFLYEHELPKSKQQRFDEWLDGKVAILEMSPGLWTKMPRSPFEDTYGMNSWSGFRKHANVEVREIDNAFYMRYIVPAPVAPAQNRWYYRLWRWYRQLESETRFFINLVTFWAILIPFIITAAVLWS